MKMKLFLALALSHNPDLLILDEPTSGLDPVFRRELSDIFAELMQSETRSIVFSTHIASDLDRIADYITFIHNGRIVFNDPKDDILNALSIVRGPKALLEEGGAGGRLIGVRQTEVGFEALTRDAAGIESIAGGRHLAIDKPNLEDVMYYFSREENAC